MTGGPQKPRAAAMPLRMTPNGRTWSYRGMADDRKPSAGRFMSSRPNSYQEELRPLLVARRTHSDNWQV